MISTNKGKGVVMNKPPKPTTKDEQRGFSIIEVLFAAANLGATILVAAMSEPKIPKSQGN